MAPMSWRALPTLVVALVLCVSGCRSAHPGPSHLPPPTSPVSFIWEFTFVEATGMPWVSTDPATGAIESVVLGESEQPAASLLGAGSYAAVFGWE